MSSSIIPAIMVNIIPKRELKPNPIFVDHTDGNKYQLMTYSMGDRDAKHQISFQPGFTDSTSFYKAFLQGVADGLEPHGGAHIVSADIMGRKIKSTEGETFESTSYQNCRDLYVSMMNTLGMKPETSISHSAGPNHFGDLEGKLGEGGKVVLLNPVMPLGYDSAHVIKFMGGLAKVAGKAMIDGIPLTNKDENVGAFAGAAYLMSPSFWGPCVGAFLSTPKNLDMIKSFTSMPMEEMYPMRDNLAVTVAVGINPKTRSDGLFKYGQSCLIDRVGQEASECYRQVEVKGNHMSPMYNPKPFVDATVNAILR